MFYYKDICSGEIVDCHVFSTYKECLDYIKKQDYLYSDFEVIWGTDVTSELLDDLKN